MVPGDNDLVSMRQGREPVKLHLKLLEGAMVGEVSGVEEEITVGDVGLGLVRVGDTDDCDAMEGFGRW